MAEYHIWQLSDPPPPPTLHTFLLRHTVNTLLIKFEHNDSDQNGNSAGNMTLQERKKKHLQFHYGSIYRWNPIISPPHCLFAVDN